MDDILRKGDRFSGGVPCTKGEKSTFRLGERWTGKPPGGKQGELVSCLPPDPPDPRELGFAGLAGAFYKSNLLLVGDLI